ncbi:MAG TPA: CBS domain-containing protein [Blastocatellia bacterium]|nr:CBS domain-containing protein [Blastocatellia bacterium]
MASQHSRLSIEAAEAALSTCKIRELKPPQPVCLEPSSTLAEAIDSMHARRSGCVLVCEGAHVRGIFTERDVLNKIAGQDVSFDSSLESFMTPNPVTAGSEDSLSDAILLMERGGYRHLPLVDASGRVEGIISIQDVIEYLADLYPTEVLNLPPHADSGSKKMDGG